MRRQPGRLRVRLAAILERALADWIKAEHPTCVAITVSPEDLYAMQGWQRSSNSASNDSFRWSGYGRFVGSGNNAATFDSFSTMTNCVRRGVDLVANGALNFDVYAKTAT